MALQACAERNLEKTWIMPSWAQNARDMPGALRRSQMPQKMARISCWQLPRDFPTALDLWCQIGVKI